MISIRIIIFISDIAYTVIQNSSLLIVLVVKRDGIPLHQENGFDESSHTIRYEVAVFPKLPV